MSDVKLKAQSRKKNFKRSLKEIPAIIYGPKSKNQNLAINYKSFAKTYKIVGESTLIDLAIDDKNPIKVLVHAIQYNPLDGNYIHVDFYQLNMTQKTQVEVTIKILGLAQAEKSTGGEAIIHLDRIIVECLPKDLVKEIKFDAREKLKEMNDAVRVADIKLPTGLKLITDQELPIVTLREIKETIIEETPTEKTETDAVVAEDEIKKEVADEAKPETDKKKGDEKE